MTTIFIDTEKRIIVSDTRMTTTSKKGDTYSKTKKFYKSNDLAIAPAGCCAMINEYLAALSVQTELGDGYISKGDSCDIAIANKYNSQVCIVTLTKTTLRTHKEIQYISKGTYITFGSGGHIANKAFKLCKDAVKSVRYAAMKDKFTNDILDVVEY